MGGWWRRAQVSPDGVAHSRMVGVSASVNLPLHHKDQKFSSGTSSSRWSQKRGYRTVVVVVVVENYWAAMLIPEISDPVYQVNSTIVRNMHTSNHHHRLSNN